MPELPPKPQAAKLDVPAELEGIEPTTGIYPATRDFAREVVKSGLIKVAVGVGSFALVCLIAGVTTSRALAQDAKAAALEAAKSQELRIITLEVQRVADRNEMNLRLERLEANQNSDHALTVGTSQKVDALLERFRVPNPAPTPKAVTP